MTYDKRDSEQIGDDLAKKTIKKMMIMMIISPLVNILIALVMAWPSMLALGTIHSHWPAIPALGFWEVVILVWVFETVVDHVKSFAR